VGLGEVVGEVVLARVPADGEVALADALADPVPPHVHGLGSADLDSGVGDPDGAPVIADDWSNCLWEAQIGKCVADALCVYCVEEGGGVLGLCCRRGDCRDDSAQAGDRAVHVLLVNRSLVAEEVETSCSGACLCLR
jgi:hypothetical protein